MSVSQHCGNCNTSLRHLFNHGPRTEYGLEDQVYSPQTIIPSLSITPEKIHPLQANCQTHGCARTSIVLAVLIFLADAVGHGLVIFRTFVLWERSAHILKLLFLGSAIVNVIATVFVGLTVRYFKESSFFIKELRVCSTVIHPLFLLGFWAMQAIFDIYVLILLLWNAMDRPRLPNQKLFKILHEDGVFLIIITWAFRMLNLLMCASGNPILPMVGMSFVESAITAINSRLLLQIFGSEKSMTRSISRTKSEREWAVHPSREIEDLDANTKLYTELEMHCMPRPLK
ncbi:hypothetical protein DFH11DRAFT_1271914 [Phellopilus nigrolimitatus]|nr:hypothetical protein DFH11DRAFT_1271914 [Phellopilus nigrolimitatus]